MDWVFPVTVVVGGLLGCWGIRINHVYRQQQYDRVHKLEHEVSELWKAVLAKRD